MIRTKSAWPSRAAPRHSATFRGSRAVDGAVLRRHPFATPGLGDGYLTAVGRNLTGDRPFMIQSRLRPSDHPAVLDLAPLPGTPEVRRHEMSFGALLQGARTAYRTVYIALEDEDVQVVPRLMVYRPR